MEYGRVVRVTTGGRAVLYVVAEEDAGKAAAMLAATAEPGAKIEPLGRASQELLGALKLSAGEFGKAS
jgi:hypothetical protein